MTKLWQYFALASIFALVACANITEKRGHLKEDANIGEIHTGTTTKDEVLKALGSPSSESTFGPPTWYYISSIRQKGGLFAPKVTDQHVTEISFDTSGTVTDIKDYSLKDAKKVQIAKRSTPTEGQQLGFMEQIMGNVGRFNKDKGTSIDHGGGTGAGLPRH